MLSENKPKEAKMAFTIENLAKSSRDTNEDNNNGFKMTPYRNPVHTASYITDCSSMFCLPNVHQSVTGVERVTISPINPSVNSPSPPLVPKYNNSVLKLPLSSEKGKSKRKRDESCEDSGLESPSPNRSRHTSEASFSSASSLTSDSEETDDSSHRRKKARTAFSSEQVYELEKRYTAQKYLPANERSKIAQKLRLSDQQVKTWFQNRRMKEKRQQRDEDHARSFSLPTGGVDVSQLAAFGLPCPPPYNIAGNSVPQLPGMPSPCLRPNPIATHHGQFPGVVTFSSPYSPSPLYHGAYPVVSTFPSPQMSSHYSHRISPRTEQSDV